MSELSPERVVHEFFDCYTNGRPEDFDECVGPDYVDYGHEPPGIGPAGARDDYENAVRMGGGVITYTIDVLVADADAVTAGWTGTLPSGATFQGRCGAVTARAGSHHTDLYGSAVTAHAGDPAAGQLDAAAGQQPGPGPVQQPAVLAHFQVRDRRVPG
jgi:SnoaL-like domain